MLKKPESIKKPGKKPGFKGMQQEKALLAEREIGVAPHENHQDSVALKQQFMANKKINLAIKRMIKTASATKNLPYQ